MKRVLTSIEQALCELKKGNFIIVYDGDKREGEADLMFHPKFATAEKIEVLRKDGGGLICLAIGKVNAEKIGLKFMTEIMRNSGMERIVCRKTVYGDEPAFSISINHKKVYTGITDNDRTHTITEFAKLIEHANKKEEFEKNFYTPGHVFLLVGRGIENRKGHTELGLELAKCAGMSETIVMCEMLGKKNALTKKEAIKYAKKKNIPFIEGGFL